MIISYQLQYCTSYLSIPDAVRTIAMLQVFCIFRLCRRGRIRNLDLTK